MCIPERKLRMNTSLKRLVSAASALLLCAASAPGQAHGYGGYRQGGYYGPGWGGVAIGLGLGFGLGWASRPNYGYGPGWYGPYGGFGAPAYGWVEPAPAVMYREPARVVYREVPVREAPPPSRPEPIIYPRNSQSAEQTEADRRDCNRWATTQPSAMNDGSVFNRAVEACMDGRGYTMR
jgi:hypothetical protein